MNSNHSPSRHFYTLDITRGMAALSVLLWHWQHFFFEGTKRVPFLREQQPLYSVFSPFYQHGGLAVDFFFALSGFVFFWLYAFKIRERKLSAQKFFFWRFSKLYPLHLASLLVVALAQVVFKAWYNTYFVYAHNDLYHFTLNLLFIPGWGFEKGWSFNAPVWAVSIEILLYITFYLVCALRLNHPFTLGILIMSGFVLRNLGLHEHLGRGLISFYLGGISYYLYAYLSNTTSFKKYPFSILSCLGLLGSIICLVGGLGLYPSTYSKMDYLIILYPIIILFLSLLETYKGPLGKRFAFMGNLTYAVYLFHFPLQVVYWAVIQQMGYNQAVFYGVPALVIYLFLLTVIAFFAYRFLEKPVEVLLRNEYQKKSWTFDKIGNCGIY